MSDFILASTLYSGFLMLLLFFWKRVTHGGVCVSTPAPSTWYSCLFVYFAVWNVLLSMYLVASCQ